MILSRVFRRSVLPLATPVIGVGLFLLPFASLAKAEKTEKHFPVKGRPIVMIQNVADGRIEVKSWKNPEIVLSASGSSNKIGVEMEQADDRIEVTANILDNLAPAFELTENIQLTVPEET